MKDHTSSSCGSGLEKDSSRPYYVNKHLESKYCLEHPHDVLNSSSKRLLL